MCKIPSYHFSVLFISVSFPGITISRKRQLEGGNPFITVSISLSSNTTHLDCLPKVNLKPIAIAAGGQCAPTITSVAIQATVRCPVPRTVLRRCRHLTIKNSSRRYTNCFASCPTTKQVEKNKINMLQSLLFTALLLQICL